MTDKEMIERPLDWPCYPLLPMKRPVKGGGFPECGFIFCDGRPRVYLEGVYGIDGRKGEKWSEVLARIKHIDYDSIDEMLNDGWRVD